jgi:hypothetical protein
MRSHSYTVAPHFSALGNTRRAWELAMMVNPARHALAPGEVSTYKVEPYLVAADVYALEPHTGRGGWTCEGGLPLCAPAHRTKDRPMDNSSDDFTSCGARSRRTSEAHGYRATSRPVEAPRSIEQRVRCIRKRLRGRRGRPRAEVTYSNLSACSQG